MIGTVASVARGEGLGSVLRRAGERLEEEAASLALRFAGAFAGVPRAALVNVAPMGTAPRLGGVQQQLVARLRVEAAERPVALVTPGTLELSAPRRHARRCSRDLGRAIGDALELTGARAVHVEGTAGMPLPLLLELARSGVDLVLGVHDFSLFCPRPHLMEEPAGEFCRFSTDDARCDRCLRENWSEPEHQSARRAVARDLLAASRALVFPSRYVLERHRELFDLPLERSVVIEPAAPEPKSRVRRSGDRPAVAFAGSVKRHKGGHLVGEIARRSGDAQFHVFGGGDEALLRALRADGRIVAHGYYRAGELTTLLERHGVGLLVAPSIVPESYGLTLSEAWAAGATAVAFDLGAQAERIRERGGGWLVPLERGAEGIAEVVRAWRAGTITAAPVVDLSTPSAAARGHLELYRALGHFR